MCAIVSLRWARTKKWKWQTSNILVDLSCQKGQTLEKQTYIIGQTIPNATPESVTPRVNATSDVETAKIKWLVALTKLATTKNAGLGTPLPPLPVDKQPQYHGSSHFNANSDAIPVQTVWQQGWIWLFLVRYDILLWIWVIYYCEFEDVHSPLDAPWAAEKRARLDAVVAGSNPRDSVIWPILFVITVPPPTYMGANLWGGYIHVLSVWIQ